MALMFKRILTFLALSSIISNPVYANNLSGFSLLKDTNKLGLRGNEFYSGYEPGAVLMKVNLWGAVHKPGIHHVPSKTNLVTLLSYAGGPTQKAILDEVIIKREQGKTSKRIKVDVDQLLDEASHHNIPLEPNDVIMIRSKEPLLSSDTVVLVGVIGTIVTIIATSIIIKDSSN